MGQPSKIIFREIKLMWLNCSVHIGSDESEDGLQLENSVQRLSAEGWQWKARRDHSRSIGEASEGVQTKAGKSAWKSAYKHEVLGRMDSICNSDGSEI